MLLQELNPLVSTRKELPPMRAQGSADRFVENIYAQFKGQPVAFLDEAYRGFDRPGEDPFYLFTAVVVEREDMESIRKELLKIAESTYWHTSESIQAEDGRQRAKRMLSYLMEGVEPCLVAKKVSIDSKDTNLEAARRDCFGTLATTLTTGVPDVSPAVNLMVMERRNTDALRKIDNRTYADLTKAGRVPRHSRLVQASPAHDRLLWLPDLVTSAVRRSLAFDDNEMFEVVADRVHFLTEVTP